MEFKICSPFYYRIDDETEKQLYQKFNTESDAVFRNNIDIPLYKGEWVKIKINDYQTYIVKPTDTLEKIAKLYNTDLEQLKINNQLTANKLFIGQRLKIFAPNEKQKS